MPFNMFFRPFEQLLMGYAREKLFLKPLRSVVAQSHRKQLRQMAVERRANIRKRHFIVVENSISGRISPADSSLPNAMRASGNRTVANCCKRWCAIFAFFVQRPHHTFNSRTDGG